MEAGNCSIPTRSRGRRWRDHTFALVTWMTAAEDASDGDTAWAKQTFGLGFEKNNIPRIPQTFVPAVQPDQRPTGESAGASPKPSEGMVRAWKIPQETAARQLPPSSGIDQTTAGEIRLVQTIEYSTAKRSDGTLHRPVGLLELGDPGDVFEVQRGRPTWSEDCTARSTARTAREQFVGTFAAPGLHHRARVSLRPPPRWHPLVVSPRRRGAGETPRGSAARQSATAGATSNTYLLAAGP